MSETVDMTNFELGLETLVEKLDIPIDKDDKEARRKYILRSINKFVSF